MPRTRLSDITINGVKVHREMLPEQFRAYCEKCSWGGPWRSIWKDWETLTADIEEDIQAHIKLVHTEDG